MKLKHYRVLVLDEHTGRVLVNETFENVTWNEWNDDHPNIELKGMDISATSESVYRANEEEKE